MNNSENTNMSIAEATYTAIKQGGEEVLQNPHRLLSFLIDMAPESPALTVLERNCDQELLEPFAEVVCGEQPPTLQSLQIAASRAHDMLVHTRAVSAEPSHQAIQQLGAGIMRYLTERSNAPLAPTPSQTAPQAPTVAPEPQPNPTTVTPTPDEHISQDSQGTWPAVSDAPAYNDVPDQIVPAPETDLSSSAGFPAQGAGAPMALHPQPTSEPEPPVAPVQPAAKPGRKKLVLLIAAIAAAAAVVAAIVMTTMRVTVYFESGGGSGSRMSVKTWKNSTIELPKSEYTRDGYTFTGWTLDGDTYHPGDSFTPSQQCSFTAAWSAQVTFSGEGADSGSAEDLLVEPGETIKLPDIEFERSGYKAEEWVDDSGTSYAAGDELVVNKPYHFKPVWRALVSFEGNGAGSGKTSDLYAGDENKVTLPECGFKYAEHVFKGWATSASGSATYSPGDTYTADSPQTFYAVWSLDPNVIDKVAIDAYGVTWESGGHTTMLRVTNNSEIPLMLRAEFVFKNSSGDTIETRRDRKMAVAPGETTSLDQYCDDSSFSSTDYTVTAEEVEDGRAPLSTCVSVKEQTVEAGKVTIRISNNGDTDAYIDSVTYYGKGYNGGEAMYYQYPETTIAAGDHLDITFEANISADRANWNNYHTRNFYLDGYVKK